MGSYVLGQHTVSPTDVMSRGIDNSRTCNVGPAVVISSKLLTRLSRRVGFPR
jgi:hypothetical protein